MKWIDKLKETRENSPLVWLVVFFFGFLAIGWGLRELVIEISGQKVVDEKKFIPPISSFTYEVGNDGLVTFTNMSENYKSLQWEYGDGSYGGLFDSTHQYTINGDYNVKLRVTNEVGDDENIVTVSIKNVELAGRVFYASGNKYPISIKIDGVSKGILSKKYTKSPDCYDEGTQTVYLPAGTYTLSGSADRGMYTWDTKVEFIKGVCIGFGLE